MKTVIRLVFFVFALTFLISQASNFIYASSEFVTNYNVAYEALPSGKMVVYQNVTLTNKLSNVYATQYSFTLDKGHPENIRALDGSGPITVDKKEDGEKTTLNLQFNKQVVGKDKTLDFTLQYEVPEFITKSGQIWEIILPKVSDKEDINAYILTLKVPLSFGKPAYITPNPRTSKIDKDSQLFTFSKDQLAQGGVVAAFGEFQVFDFTLSYHLFNPEITRAATEIALPPDTEYQKLTYEGIDPKPESVRIDEDGNWLATYKLKSKEILDVTAKGKVQIFSKPQFTLRENPQLEKYLQPKRYWEINNPEIKSLASELRTPKKIYDYVVKTLQYDYSRVRKQAQRLGASEALKTPDRAICTEYTDLFIAIARAAGIPARELNGFAYTNNPVLQPLSEAQDILHAWAEYWDDQQNVWVQVDPTWQSTTGGVDYFSQIDLGHFVFAIHGVDSQGPIPAGAYKLKKEGYFKKDIDITFGSYQEPQQPKIKVDFIMPNQVVTETSTEGIVKITNDSGRAIHNLRVQFDSQDFRILSKDNQIIDVLPPFGWKDLPLRISKQNLFRSGIGKIAVLVEDRKFTYNLSYKSMIINYLLPFFIGSTLIVLLIFATRKIVDWRFSKKGKLL